MYNQGAKHTRLYRQKYSQMAQEVADQYKGLLEQLYTYS
jgi:hypothetical protein